MMGQDYGQKDSVNTDANGRGRMNTCRDIMTRGPFACLPNDTVHKAGQLMRDQDVGSIPVVKNRDTNLLIGIITDRDLAVKVVAEDRNSTTRIEDVMTRGPVVCFSGDNLQIALDRMSDCQVRRIPVVDEDNRLLGIISQADVATRIGIPRKTAEVVKEISTQHAGA
jgi:CBS domain-containing protein